ncbi:MAG TPA: PilZ domain-containing protein [Pyrinomonadaceae bacterium]|nr:PilZ domain-containing protein [Pyrinomonadaceae bacterium]
MKTEPGRRAHRRRAVQLEVTIKFRPPASFTKIGDAGRLTLVGRTRNISESGMALVVSARNIDRYLNAKDKSFDAELRLPDGLIGLELEAVYFKKTLSGAIATYTIGSRFREAGGQSHARLAQFLQTLPLSSN